MTETTQANIWVDSIQQALNKISAEVQTGLTDEYVTKIVVPQLEEIDDEIWNLIDDIVEMK